MSGLARIPGLSGLLALIHAFKDDDVLKEVELLESSEAKSDLFPDEFAEFTAEICPKRIQRILSNRANRADDVHWNNAKPKQVYGFSADA